VKLIDLSSTRSVLKPCSSSFGSINYMAPEVHRLIKKTKTKKYYDPIKADIFSLGVMFYILYFGSPPFNEANKNCKFYSFWKARGSRQFFEDHPATEKLMETGKIDPVIIEVLS
jgi:serine/threonine protein kinase